jgi:hypothetical protein
VEWYPRESLAAWKHQQQRPGAASSTSFLSFFKAGGRGNSIVKNKNKTKILFGRQKKT